MKIPTAAYVLAASMAAMLLIRSQAAAATTGITEISITRTGSLGAGADYTLTLRKTGCAHFDGNADVPLIGHFSAFHVDFERAMNAVDSHDFFNFKGEYPLLKDGEVILDDSTATLTVVKNGFDYRVTTFGGYPMPVSLKDLFDIIDGIGLAAYWYDDGTKKPVTAAHEAGEQTVDKGAYKACITP